MAPLLSKVPEVTVGFWMAKALSTALGESTSDFLVHRLGPYAAVLIGALALLVGLGWQFSTRRYVVWTYWFAVVMVAISGTLAADAVHVGLGVPYVASCLFYAKDRHLGGLALGDGTVSAVLLLLMLFVVGYLARTARPARLELALAGSRE